MPFNYQVTTKELWRDALYGEKKRERISLVEMKRAKEALVARIVISAQND